MKFLTDYHDNIVNFDGLEFEVNPAFDIILEIRQLFEEEELNERDKITQALKMLVVNGNVDKLNIKEQGNLLNTIYKDCVKIQSKPHIKKTLPTVDFDYDGEYIYSSFMLDYGIDLIEHQGILPWKKFIALFQGLSSKTKIREVMRIRNMEIPVYNGKNGKEIREIQELKSFYALPVRGGGGKNGLDALFFALEKMASN